MEQSTDINNNEITKRKKGRPKGTGIYTEEEAKERARQRARLNYPFNFEKERERKRLEYHKKRMLFKMILFFKLYFFEFPFKQLTNYIYIRRLTNLYSLISHQK